MTEFINLFIPLPPVSINLLIGLFSTLSGLCIYFGRRYVNASEDFKRIVHEQLKGIFPEIVVYIEPVNIRDQITASIIPIKTGGEIFKHFLPFFCVGSFNQAMNNYCETARKTNWDEQLAHQQYPEMTKPGYISPKEKLNKAVQELLKFAK